MLRLAKRVAGTGRLVRAKLKQDKQIVQNLQKLHEIVAKRYSKVFVVIEI